MILNWSAYCKNKIRMHVIKIRISLSYNETFLSLPGAGDGNSSVPETSIFRRILLQD